MFLTHAMSLRHDLDMWAGTENPTPESEIVKEHLRVLEEAARENEDFDVRSSAVYEALDYLQTRSNRSWGFTVFREALEQWNPNGLKEGIKLIRRHLGLKNKKG